MSGYSVSCLSVHRAGLDGGEAREASQARCEHAATERVVIRRSAPMQSPFLPTPYPDVRVVLRSARLARHRLRLRRPSCGVVGDELTFLSIWRSLRSAGVLAALVRAAAGDAAVAARTGLRPDILVTRFLPRRLGALAGSVCVEDSCYRFLFRCVRTANRLSSLADSAAHAGSSISLYLRCSRV